MRGGRREEGEEEEEGEEKEEGEEGGGFQQGRSKANRVCYLHIHGIYITHEMDPHY